MKWTMRGTSVNVLLFLVLAVLCAGSDCIPGDGDVKLWPDEPGDVAAKTVKCTKKDGKRCVESTCKESGLTDCASWAKKCVKDGHTYDGNKKGGTCTRTKVQQ
ncbi:MAG: hypothetical protein AAF436_19140 [Myxococcota bacterium]